MPYQNRGTILETLYSNVRSNGNRIFLKQPYNGKYYEYTWTEAFQQICLLSGLLQSLGLEQGSKIGILSKNCAEWFIADLAILKAGYVSVPLYPNINAKTIFQILEHSETKVLLVGKLDNWDEQKIGVPKDVQLIGFPMFGPEKVIKWDDWKTDFVIDQQQLDRRLDELTTIIYTSGTTGMPKGVMHSYQAFSEVANVAFQLLDPPVHPVFFSYLPLSHIAERVLVEMGVLYLCGTVCFAESIERFPENLRDAEPTVFLGVPRIWTKFQMGILEKLNQERLDFFLKIPILSSLIKSKIKKELGLHKCEFSFSGAAPISISLIKWFEKIGIDINEGYAMTENCCYSHITIPGNKRYGYVGKPLPGCEVKLSDENEVLIKNKSVMIGYYKEPELTKAAITPEGFLHTGDVGEIDPQGFLKIIGRVKDNFKTTKGKYVAPNPIELQLLANDNIEQCCVVGHNIPQPICLVVLSEKSKKMISEQLENILAIQMLSINDGLEGHEKMAKLVIVKEPWTVENELLTPTLKVKRQAIDNYYGKNYEAWYELSGQVVRE